jgi:hypothetical protein
MRHWLTQFTEDGEPEGVLCDCPIDADHLPSGEVYPEEEQMR